MTSTPESELDALRRKNDELSGQVKELVRVSTRMHRLRATLEDRQRLYRALARFLGEELPKASDVDDVAVCAATFVAYEIGFERVIVVADCLQRVHHIGFWDDETLPDRVLAADHDLGTHLRVHTPDDPQPDLEGLARRLGLIEFVCRADAVRKSREAAKAYASLVSFLVDNMKNGYAS
ncbi:MAG: hypothetical protein AAF602_32755, partial [Myxococcota bacterium]